MTLIHKIRLHYHSKQEIRCGYVGRIQLRDNRDNPHRHYHQEVITIMPNKKRKKKKSNTASVASLYSEDIGIEGLKRKRLSATNEISFELPVDEEEESKRRGRMVSDRST